MKKIVSVVLCIAICILSTFKAYASEPIPEVPIDYDVKSLYNQASAFAKEQGISLLPFNEAFPRTSDALNLHNNEKLKNIHQIGDGASASTNGISSSSARPIYVSSTCYDSISRSYEEDWYKFTANGSGAYNIYSLGALDTKVELYEENIWGNLILLENDDDSGEGSNFRIEPGLSSGNNYYIKVTAFGSKTGSYSIRLEENRESLYSPNGGSWSWTISYPDPDGYYFSIDKIVYLPQNEVDAYYILVSNDNYRTIRDMILSTSIDAVVGYLTSAFGITKAVATFIISEVASKSFPTLTSLELDSIKRAAGIDAYGHASRGIKIVSCTAYSTMGIPVTTNVYETWTGSTIYGQARYRGQFDMYDKTPLWR